MKDNISLIGNWRSKEKPVYLIYLLLLVITMCVYFSALNNSFIFDDEVVILENIYIKNISLVPKVFKTDIFYFQHQENPLMGKYYRPLQALSYSFDYFFWKLNPVGYRLVNIALHSLNALFIYLIICLIFKDKILGFFSAVIFCVHPIQVSDVSFISVRAVLMAAFFMLFSLFFLIKYFVSRKKRYFFLSLVAYPFALLSWEMALLLPALILLVALFSGIDKKRLFYSLFPFFFLTVLYMIFRARFIPCDKLSFSGAFSIKSAKEFFYYVGDYFSQLILPQGSRSLVLGRSILPQLIFLFFWVFLFAATLFKALIFENRKYLFAFVFFFIGLLPVIKLWDSISAYGTVVAEHYAYIASIGFFMLIACFILDLGRYLKRTIPVIAVLLVCFYSILTVINNANYKNNIVFYNYLLSLNPSRTFFRVNLADAYYKQKMFGAAEQQARLVLSSEPNAWEIHLFLGNIFKEKGNFDKAVSSYNKALALYPKSFQALNNLALIYETQGKTKEAADFFDKALKVNPESLLVLKNLAGFLIKNKLYDQAMLCCRKILALDPHSADGCVLQGIIFAETGSLSRARDSFGRAIELDPGSSEALKNLGVLYANTGNLGAAIALWERAQSLDPSNEEIRNDLSKARKLKGSGGKNEP